MARAKASAKKKNVISLDFEGVEARVLVPEGDYFVKPVEVSKEDGNEYPYLNWKLEITRDDFEGKPLYVITSTSPAALWNLRGMLEAMGIDVPEGVLDLDLDTICEEAGEFCVTVEHESYEGKNRARVVDAFPAGDEEPEPETKPKGKGGKEKPATTAKGKGKAKEPEPATDEEPDFDEMDADELEAFIDEHDLDVDLDDHKTLKKKRAAVSDAWDERDTSGEGDGDEKYTEDAINEMGTADLAGLVKKHELDVELEGTTKAKRRAVIKALKAEDLIEE